MEACADVFYAADDELNVRPRHAQDAAQPDAAAAPFRSHRHRIAGARPGWPNATAVSMGFGIAAQREDMTFLSFLFVRPDAQAAESAGRSSNARWPTANTARCASARCSRSPRPSTRSTGWCRASRCTCSAANRRAQCGRYRREWRSRPVSIEAVARSRPGGDRPHASRRPCRVGDMGSPAPRAV